MNAVGYIYVLRVPIIALTALILMASGPFGGPGESILEGIFDVSYGTDSWLSLVRFFILAVAAFLLALAIGLTARIIVLDGSTRFGLAKLPDAPGGGAAPPGIELLFRLIPLLVGWYVLIAAIYQTESSLILNIAGAMVGFAAVYVFLPKLFAAVLKHLPAKNDGPLNRLIKSIPGDKEGYIDNGEVNQRHRFALAALIITLIIYAVLGLLKKAISFGERPVPIVSTLAMFMLLITVLCWIFAGLTFFLDRFRVPVILVAGAYLWVTGLLPQTDAFYRTKLGSSLPARYQLIRPAQALAPGNSSVSGQPVIVIAAEGGGIRAAAWTARVLEGLHFDAKNAGKNFDAHVRLISSVSGGSTGAMYYLASFRGNAVLDRNECENGAKSGTNELDRSPVVAAAEASSLDEVAWGLLYPDTIFRVAPILRLYRPLLFSGRGNTLEEVWRQQLRSCFKNTDGSEITLGQWRRELVDGASARPAVIFNSTLVETGERYLLGTTDLEDMGAEAGRRPFHFGSADIGVATAARLSATFTYVSPAAREYAGEVYKGSFHAVDGGYYDNYGMSSLLEWLSEALNETAPEKLPSKVLIVEIRSSAAHTDTEELLAQTSTRGGGFIFQAAAPVATELHVRDTAQLAHNVAYRNLLRDSWRPRTIEPVVFAYEDRDEHNKPAPEPLNWHLTPDDVGHLRHAWSTMESKRQQVMNFLK
jgi:hypothetical protein